MVVADNDINAFASRISDLLHRFDTAVECDNQIASLCRCVVDALGRDTIALGVAVGDVVVDFGYWTLRYWVLDALWAIGTIIH